MYINYEMLNELFFNMIYALLLKDLIFRIEKLKIGLIKLIFSEEATIFGAIFLVVFMLLSKSKA